MSAAPKPLSERIRDVVSDLVDGLMGGLLETLGGLMNPPPVPVPIPVRGRRGRMR